MIFRLFGILGKLPLSLLNMLPCHACTAFSFTNSSRLQFALTAVFASVASLEKVLPTAFRIWIEVLIDSLATHMFSREEDEANKKDRPTPSKGIILSIFITAVPLILARDNFFFERVTCLSMAGRAAVKSPS